MHLWSFMICGHSGRYWWFVRDGFSIQIRLRPRFHRRLAEPTEQLDDTLRRIWRSQSSICARRLRRPGIVEDQVSVCRMWCHSDVNSIVFSHSSSVLSLNVVHFDSIPCNWWEGPILRTPRTFDEHLICCFFGYEKSRPMHYQVSILRSAVGRDRRNRWRRSRRCGNRGVFLGVCIMCLCSIKLLEV